MSKLDRIRHFLNENKAGLAIVSDPVTVNYLTGFDCDPHERQMFLFVYENREPALVVPALEVARASAVLDFPVFGYVDSENPWQKIKAGLASTDSSIIYAEFDNLNVTKFQGLQTVFEGRFENLTPFIQKMRVIKSADEIQKMIAWWLDKGIDGFRMDVINLISKDQDNIYQDSPIKGHSVSANGPRVHEYIRELTDNVFSKYDVMTVGEAPAVTTKEAIQYASNDGKEMSMVFQFELMDVDGGEKQKWSDERFKLTDVKAILRKWQIDMHGRAWNSLFWNNHDQPRVVSRFGDTSSKETWEKSAKMLATAQYFLQGTPYIYQGEELGMTNVEFKNIGELRDIESINSYHQYVEVEKMFTPEEMLRFINKSSRDHARTPMQWNDLENAGFSDAEPWIKVNQNYKWLNAQAQITDENSIFNYYKKMISILKENEVVQFGDYQEYYEDSNEVYVYKREYDGKKLFVLSNFTAKEVTYDKTLFEAEAKVLLGNYNDLIRGKLRAYEAVVLVV